LLFFDQLLANYFAQLAHAGDLFSFDGDESRTYFAGRLDDDALRLGDVRAGEEEEHQAAVDALTEDPGTAAGRRNRFLSHLLARFAEQLTDYSLVLFDAMPAGQSDPAEKLVRDKRAFLRDYPRLSGGRGTAASYLTPPGGENVSGLEERVRRKLGLLDEEETILIEHVLLRPMEEDEVQDVPLLAAAAAGDPFSHQLSFVFRDPPRLPKAFVERVVREETPAHLVPHVRWLEEAAWTKLHGAWTAWLEKRRAYWTQELGLTE
jgi:hypothetical protein